MLVIEWKTTETLVNLVVRNADIHQCEIRDANRKFKIELNKIDTEVPLDLPNPKYQDLKNKYDN